MAEMVSAAGVAWARRDGAGVPGVAVVPPALSVLAVLVPGDVAVLSSTVSAVALVLVPSSALPVSLLTASACACCSVVA